MKFENFDTALWVLLLSTSGAPGTAGRNAAAELGARKADFITQDPEQGYILRQIHLVVASVDPERGWHGADLCLWML